MTTNLVLRAHPFTMDTGYVPVKSGQTIAQMLMEATEGAELRDTLRVEIGGYEVPASLWHRVRPKQGTAIHVTAMPAGSGSGRKIWRTVLLVVVAVVAWYVVGPAMAGTYGLTATQWAAAAYMVGSMLVNALVPPPRPAGPGSTQGTDGTLNALTGSSNQMAPYGPIPCVIGESRIYPPHAAMPYMEALGVDMYQRLMFDLGYGDLEVSDIRIGDTPLADFEGVDYEITTDPTLYTADVQETAVTVTLANGESAERTTAPLCEEISLDIMFPQGLFGVNSKGKSSPANVFFRIEYRPVGGSGWFSAADAPGLRTAGGIWEHSTPELPPYNNSPFISRVDHRKPYACSVGWKVPQGQYEVRVTRVFSEFVTDDENRRAGDTCQWAVLRSIRKVDPSRTGTTKLVMRIKSSEQLNGTLQTLSCHVKQKIRVYDDGVWSAPVANVNTAWVAHWLLTECPAFATHVPDARIALQDFIEYAEFCDTNSFETRGVLDSRMTARELLDDVLACSLATLSLRDGKYGVMYDNGNEIPTMAFTPLDATNFMVSRTFTRIPHALKVRFKNPAAGWKMDEIVVLDDGYSYRGVDARGNPSTLPEPTVFETLELRMAADAIHAWQLGRSQFAQAKFRPANYSWDTDIANLGCVRGDLVHVAHDVTEWGDGFGRVVSIAAGGPLGTYTLVLDDTVETTAGTSYSVQIRKQDGSSVALSCTPHSPETNTFYIPSSPAGVQPGDVAVIGETGQVTERLLITGITPQRDLAARITAVAYDERVAPYWADPPESIVSEITGTAYDESPDPPVINVVINTPINDPSDDSGNTQPRAYVSTRRQSSFATPYRTMTQTP